MIYDQQAPIRGAIVAMTRDHVIGLDGGMPWHYSEDLKRFKRVTMGSAIIMGRKTWESIGRKPLPGRRNIVISRQIVDGVECFNDPHVAITECEKDDFWIIGGGQIYRETLPALTLLDVTYVPESIDHADVVKFPQLDPSQWDIHLRTSLGETELENVIYHRCG